MLLLFRKGATKSENLGHKYPVAYFWMVVETYIDCLNQAFDAISAATYHRCTVYRARGLPGGQAMQELVFTWNRERGLIETFIVICTSCVNTWAYVRKGD